MVTIAKVELLELTSQVASLKVELEASKGVETKADLVVETAHPTHFSLVILVLRPKTTHLKDILPSVVPSLQLELQWEMTVEQKDLLMLSLIAQKVPKKLSSLMVKTLMEELLD